MQKTLKKELSFSLDTLERYRAKYGRSASLDTNGHNLTASHTEPQRSDPPATVTTATTPVRRSPPPSLFKANSPPKMTKLQELQQKKEAYLRAKAHEREMEQLQRDQEKYKRNGTAHTLDITKPKSSSSNNTTTPSSTSNNNTETTKGSSSSSAAKSSTPVADQTQQTASKTPAGYSNWGNSHATLCSQPWCAISDLMYFCDKYEFKTLSTRDLKTHQEIVAEVRALLSGKAPFDQRTRFPGNIHDPENLWVCIGRCASVEYHLQRIINVFRKPLNQLTPDKQRTVRQNFHLAVSELRLDISARISEVRLYDRLVFEREFRLEWQDEA